jgi:AI-2 transport protein TqsA
MQLKHFEQRAQTVCLLILALVAMGFALNWLRPVMIPFVLALFFVVGLTPLIDLLTGKCRLPRWLALAITAILAVVLLSVASGIVSISVAQLTSNASRYQNQLQNTWDEAFALLHLEQYGVEADFNPLTLIPAGTVNNMISGITNAVMKLLSQGTLVLIFMIFLLVGGSRRPKIGGSWGEVESQVKRYLVTKIIVSAVTGILVGLTLMLLGVELALAFGFLTFLLNFIPSLGSIIATLLPLPVVLMSDGLPLWAKIAAIAIPTGIQFAIGNVIEPKILGKSLGLHPIVIIMALIFWGMLWGIVGMLLAVPITSVIRMFMERIDLFKPLADLMAGKWETNDTLPTEKIPGE